MNSSMLGADGVQLTPEAVSSYLDFMHLQVVGLMSYFYTLNGVRPPAETETVPPTPPRVPQGTPGKLNDSWGAGFVTPGSISHVRTGVSFVKEGYKMLPSRMTFNLHISAMCRLTNPD